MVYLLSNQPFWKAADQSMYMSEELIFFGKTIKSYGLSRELNPGPRAPEARIIPLDHWAELIKQRSAMICNILPSDLSHP